MSTLVRIEPVFMISVYPPCHKYGTFSWVRFAEGTSALSQLSFVPHSFFFSVLSSFSVISVLIFFSFLCSGPQPSGQRIHLDIPLPRNPHRHLPTIWRNIKIPIRQPMQDRLGVS